MTLMPDIEEDKDKASVSDLDYLTVCARCVRARAAVVAVLAAAAGRARSGPTCTHARLHAPAPARAPSLALLPATPPIHPPTAPHAHTPQELLAIQQNDGPKDIGFFGTRNMGVTHQKLVEILSYAYATAVSAGGQAGRQAGR